MSEEERGACVGAASASCLCHLPPTACAAQAKANCVLIEVLHERARQRQTERENKCVQARQPGVA